MSKVYCVNCKSDPEHRFRHAFHHLVVRAVFWAENIDQWWLFDRKGKTRPDFFDFPEKSLAGILSRFM